MSKLSNPYILIGVLILTILATGILTSTVSSSDNITSLENGTTVTAGTKLIDTQNIAKIPLMANPSNILGSVKSLNILDIFTTITTGTSPKDVIKDNTFISNNGTVSNKLQGPGIVVTDSEGKISVKKPTKIIWGYKKPDTVAVKNGDSIKIVRNNTTLKTLSQSEITNDSIPTDYQTVREVKSWMNSSKDGANLTLDFYLSNFNDNRSDVHGKKNITNAFGNSTYAYMRNYTDYAPVLVYEHNATKTEISNGSSIVKSLAGYPTETRASNAKEFAVGWNGTIIPPHTSAHGKTNVTFTSIQESESESGWATHGVCPAGRSLRAAVLALGYPCPVGMASSDEDAILFGFAPTTEVAVSNMDDYPIQIIMWSTGDGGNTQIFTKIIELKDNNTYVSGNSSNNTTSTTNITN